MRKKIAIFVSEILMLVMCCFPVHAAATVPKEDTPDYKVAFYAFDCYHMQDGNGKRYGYGYDMMQEISENLQCTFSYIGYDKSAAECEEMLKKGEIDIYTAAKKTPQREKIFAFSTHPAITAKTCMNVKRGNHKVVAGKYATYNGLKIGLLKRHTYNGKFIQFTKSKGFDCDIIYYTTPTELSNALIDGEVDATVNSYIRTPEDEKTIEDFGETPYYFMTKKKNESLIHKIDASIDEMNIETPNWRSDLYNEYYGSQNSNTEFTSEEKKLLKKMQASHTKITATMNPERNPYSWFDDGRGYGIIADIFTTTVNELDLEYEIIPASSKESYEKILVDGKVDICLDLDSYYEDEGKYKYKMTDSYLTTSASLLHRRGSSGRINKVGVIEDNIAIKEIVSSTWPTAEIIYINDIDDCTKAILNEKVDGILMMSYMAQKIARDDTQNRFSVDIVPGGNLKFKMGINSKDNRNFFGIWEKTLMKVSQNKSAELVQNYLEMTTAPTLAAYLFDHPAYLFGIVGMFVLTLFIISLYIQSTRAHNKQLEISEKLSLALMEAREANDAKLNFFSKMSHDIRTPLNAVLGMTQIAKKYKDDEQKLDNALDNIKSEGNYLLAMINSILDVNQLEHGHIELIHNPFNLSECMYASMKLLEPLAHKKKQELLVFCDFSDHIVIGDSNRLSQIMVNIVSNAIKYTDMGGRIEVKLEEYKDHHYRFTCTDNGIGMTQEYIKHICEDYSRSEDSKSSGTEGTGLGMAVVKGFTDLMHGNLHIKSKLGQGSSFIVEIPFEKPTMEEKECLIRAASQEKEHLNFKNKRVLLVEDNDLNAEIAMELLQSIGFCVDLAENGEVAVKKFEESKINTYFAIFMDMQMPVMNGVEATKKIRSLSRSDKDILILAMTANTLAKDRVRCEEAGMDGYITKPIDLKEIENILRQSMSL